MEKKRKPAMMLEKPGRTKKRKRHKKSILHEKDRTCYLCVKLNQDYRIHRILHEHHVFGGPNRALSEAEGLKVHLCTGHHLDGPEAVHNNQGNMRILKQDAQRAYEMTHSRSEFMNLIGRNYLREEDEEPGKAEPGETEPGEIKKEPAAGIWFLEERESDEKERKI